jgi:hypothetical protein
MLKSTLKKSETGTSGIKIASISPISTNQFGGNGSEEEQNNSNLVLMKDELQKYILENGFPQNSGAAGVLIKKVNEIMASKHDILWRREDRLATTTYFNKNKTTLKELNKIPEHLANQEEVKPKTSELKFIVDLKKKKKENFMINLKGAGALGVVVGGISLTLAYCTTPDTKVAVGTLVIEPSVYSSQTSSNPLVKPKTIIEPFTPQLSRPENYVIGQEITLPSMPKNRLEGKLIPKNTIIPLNSNVETQIEDNLPVQKNYVDGGTYLLKSLNLGGMEFKEDNFYILATKQEYSHLRVMEVIVQMEKKKDHICTDLSGLLIYSGLDEKARSFAKDYSEKNCK